LRDEGRDRIAIFLPSLAGGGAERVLVRVVSEIVRRNCAVDLVLGEAVGVYMDDVHPDVRIVDLESRRVLTALPGLFRYLRRTRPEVLLSSLAHANVMVTLARTLARVGTRIVLREANMVSEMRDQRKRAVAWAMPWAYRAADHIIAVSNGVAEDVEHALGVDPQSISTIYNPTNIEEIRKRAEEGGDHPWMQSHTEGPPVVLGVGRLTEQKDYETLIRAFRRVRESQPVRLIILGEGPRREELEALAEGVNVAEDVSLPGFVENPYAFMRRANVFVLSSAWEGMPNALIEAFVLGTPLVSTDCPSGPREILADGKWGRLVPVGDEQAMAQAIRATLESNEAASEKAIQQRATGRFELEEVATQYLDVLRGVNSPTA
jgi:glycosyltransferase involved in cell wall biosynthesis